MPNGKPPKPNLLTRVKKVLGEVVEGAFLESREKVEEIMKKNPHIQGLLVKYPNQEEEIIKLLRLGTEPEGIVYNANSKKVQSAKKLESFG